MKNSVFIVVLCLLCGFSASAQSLAISDVNSNTQTYALKDIKLITFSATTIDLRLTDGSTFSLDLSAIQSLSYLDEDVVINEQLIAGLNRLNLVLYPNPTPGTIELKYLLSEPTSINIDLFNNNGILIEHLFDGFQSSAEYLLPIQLPSLPAGSYILQLKGEDFAVTKQLIVQE